MLYILLIIYRIILNYIQLNLIANKLQLKEGRIFQVWQFLTWTNNNMNNIYDKYIQFYYLHFLKNKHNQNMCKHFYNFELYYLIDYYQNSCFLLFRLFLLIYYYYIAHLNYSHNYCFHYLLLYILYPFLNFHF